MGRYYVNSNAQLNGDHEVHTEGCPFPPETENRIHLGVFHGCLGAVQAARNYYQQVNGCAYCSPACHTQ